MGRAARLGRDPPMNFPRKLLNEMGGPGHRGPQLPRCDVPTRPLGELLPGARLRETLALPRVSEPEVVRHFVEISTLNHHVDKGLYPLGSCTMKHNPKINDELASLPGFANAHPLAPDAASQGCLRVLAEIQRVLADITGFAAVTPQPAACAHGEMTGLMIIRAHHRAHGQTVRRKVIVPDSAHGTNPASVNLLGWYTVAVPSEESATMSGEALGRVLDDETAAVMITVPNT